MPWKVIKISNQNGFFLQFTEQRVSTALHKYAQITGEADSETNTFRETSDRTHTAELRIEVFDLGRL